MDVVILMGAVRAPERNAGKEFPDVERWAILFLFLLFFFFPSLVPSFRVWGFATKGGGRAGLGLTLYLLACGTTSMAGQVRPTTCNALQTEAGEAGTATCSFRKAVKRGSLVVPAQRRGGFISGMASSCAKCTL
jgi:hypothetical protein